MPEAIHREEPIAPMSLSSVWRSTAAQMEVYRSRPTPTCAFLLALAVWSAAAYRLLSPQAADPDSVGACLTADALFAPGLPEMRRYLLHVLWPLEPGYVRGFLASSALLIHGCALEYEMGTLGFVAHLAGFHVATAAALLRFRLSACQVSLEPSLAALAVVIHHANPKVHTDGLEKTLRLPFAIEPRWHVWAIQVLLLLTAGNFPQALVVQAVGLGAGVLCSLRDPGPWLAAWDAFRQRSFTCGAFVHMAMLLFTLLAAPLTAEQVPAVDLAAFADGRALQPAWWAAAAPGSAALLPLALKGLVASEALFICKLMLSLAFPLLLSPLRLWAKFYSGGCVLLVMYSMTSDAWKYPHLGFALFFYLAYAFWRLDDLPDTVPEKSHAS